MAKNRKTVRTSGPYGDRLPRDDLQRQPVVAAEEGQVGPDADALLGQEPVEVVDAGDGVAVEGDEDVAFFEARRGRRGRPGSIGDDQDAAVAGEVVAGDDRGGQRRRSGPTTPIRLRRTRPSRIRRPATYLAVLIAIAKQIPCAGRITAVFTPITSPRESTSGPPELPGLSAASVWSTSSISRPDFARSDRPRALTTPAVTVHWNP